MKFLLLILLLPCALKAQQAKCDTIGPVLRLVSDTSHDAWNSVYAMGVYEVGFYGKGVYMSEDGVIRPIFHRIKWLDSHKKLLTLKVWEYFELRTGKLIDGEYKPSIYLYLYDQGINGKN